MQFRSPISTLPVVSAYCCVLTLNALTMASDSTHQAKTEKKVLTRVFFQDDEQHQLKWFNILAGNPPVQGPIESIQAFPKLDSQRQTLVQMEAAHGKLLVGVRDDDDGKFQSGWVLVDTGADEEEHGTHNHWYYPRSPRVCASVLDQKQGNPAHLYCYDQTFYLANDKLDGFTQLAPDSIKPGEDTLKIVQRARWFPGGGGHITLAVVDNKVAFSTWIDREGPNVGRIDVTRLNTSGTPIVDHSFQLPHGGIHGAISCQGKIFFAPTDGIYWVQANMLGPTPATPPVTHHLSLGKSGVRPNRTGSFHSWRNCVGFVTGSGTSAAVGFIDARKTVPEVIKVPLEFAEDSRPVGPSIVKPKSGAPLAFVFHDHSEETETACKLSLIELKIGANGALLDAKRVETLAVGDCRVDGHSGHHDVSFDANRRYAVFTNPGDGTITLLSLQDRKPVAEFKVGGIPSKILCVGGASSSH